MNGKSITESERAAIIADYNGGLTQQNIAKKYHHSMRIISPILKSQFANRNEAVDKRDENKVGKRAIRKIDNAYNDAFRMRKACGETDREIWNSIHKTMDKHGVKWRPKDFLRIRETRKKGVYHSKFYRKISTETIDAVFKWIKDNGLTQAIAAEKNGFSQNVFTRLKNSRKLQSNREAYKKLKKLCADNNIFWKDKTWENEDAEQ